MMAKWDLVQLLIKDSAQKNKLMLKMNKNLIYNYKVQIQKIRKARLLNKNIKIKICIKMR